MSRFILQLTTILAACAGFGSSPLAAKSSSFVDKSGHPVLVAATTSVPVPGGAEVLFQERPYRPELTSEFIKMSFAFSPAVKASAMMIESCGGEFKDSIEVALHPGARRIFAEGGSTQARLSFGDHLIDIESLTVNFRRDSKVCVKAVRFQRADGSAVAVKVREPVVSENPAPEEYKTRVESFVSAGVPQLLNHEFTSLSEEDRWIFRFRGDGTFFVFGKNDDARMAGKFSALGRFRIVDQGKRSLRLQLTGKKHVTPEPWDGWICEDLCQERRPTAQTEFVEMIEIERMKNGGYMIRNRERPHRRALPFSDMSVTSAAH